MTWKSTSRKDGQRAAGKSGWDEQRAAQRILERDGHRCYLLTPGVCVGHATEVDHVVPLYITGSGGDVDSNKRAICQPCHKVKSKAEAAESRRRNSGRNRPREPHPGLKW